MTDFGNTYTSETLIDIRPTHDKIRDQIILRSYIGEFNLNSNVITSMKINSKDAYVDLVIWETNDEWFKVLDKSNVSNMRGYLCDQLDGLMMFLKDKNLLK
jgi:hypothetical protein